jgi:hypothetical protein
MPLLMANQGVAEPPPDQLICGGQTTPVLPRGGSAIPKVHRSIFYFPLACGVAQAIPWPK